MVIEQEQETFRVPAENLPALEAKIAQLNKTAQKLDVEPIVLTKGEVELVEKREHGITRFYEFVSVQVTGQAPKLEGWTFAATLEHSEGGVVIRKVPGADADLTDYRTANADDCDQCGYKRRRKNTYVVLHDDGTLKQVGSNCLKDFLGHQTPQQAARYAEWLIELDDFLRGGGGPPREPVLVSAADYLADVAMYVRTNGWVSRGQAWENGGEATADSAAGNFWNRANGKRYQGVNLWEDPSEEDIALAEKALAWAQAIEEHPLVNDYLYNLRTVLVPGTVRTSQFGIAASAVTAYQRATAQELERKTSRLDEFWGEAKDRYEGTLTVFRVFTYTTDYGTVHKHIFRDEEGRTFVWKATNGTELEQGESFNITGKVKEHEDTKFGKQTILTYCKVVD